MNEYVTQLTMRSMNYGSDGSSNAKFDLNVLVANGACFALGFCSSYFLVYKFIPGIGR